jgi:gliding motility-associated-like protein
MLGTISFPVSANSAGIYSVTGENQFSCKSTNTLQVLVLPAPIISVSNQTTCIGGNFNYTITGAQTYTWTGPSNFTTTGAAIHMTNCNDSNEGQYVVIATGTNNCKNSASLTLNVFTVSPAQVSIQGKNTICRNDYTQLIIKGANTYKWYGPNGFTSVNDTVTIFGFGQIVSGIYTVECKDALFCNSTKTLQLSLMENPKLQFENINNATCVPFCNRFRFTISPEPATTKLIQVFDQLNKVVDITQNYCFEKPGQYFFHSFYRDTNNCLATASLIVTAHERILADFIYTPEKAIAGNDVINFYNSSIGNNQSQWSWIFGTSDTSYYQGQNQHYSFQQSGNYPIVLIVSNKWQCQDTVIKVISVGSEYSFYIPNCFSPNGDGINDDFGAKAFGIIDFHITIFNRWGALIFESSELDRRWDGTFKNTLCPPDVYTYRIATKDFAGNRKEYAGHVSILK